MRLEIGDYVIYNYDMNIWTKEKIEHHNHTGKITTISGGDHCVIRRGNGSTWNSLMDDLILVPSAIVKKKLLARPR